MKLSRRSVLALVGFPISGIAQRPVKIEVGGDYVAQFESWLTQEAEKHWTRREREIASLDASGVRKRQEYVRRTMLELIGEFPTEKSPLNAKVTGSFDRDGYRVENVIFESQPGFRVTANLYLPTVPQPPFPAVIGVAGHSLNGKASATYQHAFIGFAKRGCAVFAIDPPGQGERLEYYAEATNRSMPGAGVPEHNMAGLQCLLTGHTFARYEVWDGIRAFDYLLTRPEIDPKRIGVAGNSGGGTQAAYLAVFEPRLAGVVSSCYMTRWRELWSGPGPQDAEQIFPRFIEKGLDFSDFMLAIAPPFLMTTAIRDYFPIDGARATFKEAERLFDLIGNADRVGYFEYDDTHGWSQPRREAAYRWLGWRLQKRDDNGKEPPIETEEESVLNATATGQLATSGGSETVQSLNRKQADRLVAKRAPLNAAAIARAIGLRDDGRTPPATPVSAQARGSVGVAKLELTTEGGVRIPALHYMPATRSGRAIVFVSSFGKDDDDIAELAQMKAMVLAIDPRGMGEGYAPRPRGGYSQAYQLAARAMLVGRNLLEMQVADLSATVRYLHSHTGANITLYAKGESGPSAIFTAALMPAVAELAIERSIVSYGSVVDAKIHFDLERTVAPGILQHLDLPAVLSLLGGRPATLISPIRPNGTPLPAADVTELTKGSGAKIVLRGEGWPLRRAMPHWFAA